jgi:HK97 gp10 family phage protein
VKVTFEVEGLNECEEALEDLVNTLGASRTTGKNVLKRSLLSAGKPTADLAQRLAPKRRGHLAASITVSTQLSPRQRRMHRKVSPVEVYIGAGQAPHAHLQEFGTPHHAPQPFLRPAIDQTGKQIIDIFQVEIRKETDRAVDRAKAKAARIKAKFKA